MNKKKTPGTETGRYHPEETEPMADLGRQVMAKGGDTAAGGADDIAARLKVPRYVLFIILGLAAVLRMIGLNSRGLWIDELITVIEIRKGFGSLLEFTGSDIGPQILTYLPTYLLHFISEQPGVLRLAGFGFGVACVWALYWTLRPLTVERSAIGAAFILACLPFHIWHSQDMRGYTQLMFFILLAWGSLERSWLLPKLRYHLGFILAMTAAMYTSFIALLFYPAFIIYGLLVLRTRGIRSLSKLPGLITAKKRIWLITLFLPVVLFLPLIWNGLGIFGSEAGVRATYSLGWPFAHFYNTLLTFLCLQFRPAGSWFIWVNVIVGLSLIAKRRSSLGSLNVALVFVPLLFFMILRPHHSPYPRYFFMWMPLLAWWTAEILDLLSRVAATVFLVLRGQSLGKDSGVESVMKVRNMSFKFFYVLIVIWIGGYAMTACPYYYQNQKQDWAGAVNAMCGELERGDAVITGINATEAAVYYYCTPKAGVELATRVHSVDSLEGICRPGRRVWYITGSWRSGLPEEYYNWLENNFSKHEIYPGMMSEIHLLYKAR
jgi:hypothetical protein